jgi:hypothetical protein
MPRRGLAKRASSSVPKAKNYRQGRDCYRSQLQTGGGRPAFSDRPRLWIEDEGRTLVERRSEAAKDAFAKKIATQIWLAVGYEADGRQSLRPIEDMATAEMR